MTKANGKVQEKKFQKILLKHFAEKGKENFTLNDSLFLSNLKNAKTNTILTS